MAREKRCVECGHKVKSLFIQYSPGNFRLMKCENCEEVADEYVECELMIIFIDLILHKTKAYRHLLYNVVNQETANIQVFPAPADRERIKSCLSELGELSNTFKQLLNSGMEQLVATVTPRIRPVLDTVATISYELTETEYAENEVNDPWVQRLLHSVETNAAWLQPLMTSNNYDSFLHLIIDFIVRRLEVIMMQKRFSQLGGLQLDRDTRALVSHFSGMTQRTVRDKFARLTQMATILNLEKVSEILDFWGENSGPMTWRLTPAEVRRVLGLRVEFKPESITALKL